MKKVLILDQDNYILDFLAHGLQAHNYATLTAQDGAQALQLIQQHKPELLILDSLSSRLDVLQICRELKKKGQTKNIPIIMMSAFQNDKRHDQYKSYGVKFILNKPFGLDELLGKVDTLLAGKRTY